jgi:hypothetical protein
LIYDPDDDDAIETILDEKTGEFVKLPSSSRQTTTLDVVAVSMRLVERAHREKSKENERSRGGNEKSVDKKKTKKKKKAVKTREEDDDMETTAPARLIRQSNRLNRDRVASEETDEEEEEVVVVSSSPKKKLAPSKKPKKVAKNQEEATKPTRVVRPSNRLWDRVGSRDTDEEEEEEVVVVSSPSKIQLAPSKKTKKIVKNHDEEVETTKSTRVFRKSKQRFRDRVGWEGTDNEDEPIVSSPPRMPLAPPTKPKKIVKDPDIFLCKYITWAEVFRRENEIRAKNGDPPLKAKQKKKKKPPVLRNPLIKRGTRYTEEEDLIILEYVKEHDGFRKIKGRAFWAKASIDEASGCVRTWQSLKERVYKMIVPRIHQ